jgi:hypothetical protein
LRSSSENTRVFFKWSGTGFRVDEVRDRLVDREARVRIQHLVAFLEQREHDEEHDRLGTGRDDDVVGVARNAALRAPDVRDRLAELRQPRGRAVMRPALLECLGRRLADELRRVEVGLADLEVNDLAAGRLERARTREHLERGLGSQTAHAVCERHPLLLREAHGEARGLPRSPACAGSSPASIAPVSGRPFIQIQRGPNATATGRSSDFEPRAPAAAGERSQHQPAALAVGEVETLAAASAKRGRGEGQSHAERRGHFDPRAARRPNFAAGEALLAPGFVPHRECQARRLAAPLPPHPLPERVSAGQGGVGFGQAADALLLLETHGEGVMVGQTQAQLKRAARPAERFGEAPHAAERRHAECPGIAVERAGQGLGRAAAQRLGERAERGVPGTRAQAQRPRRERA